MKVLWIILLTSFLWIFTKFEGNDLPQIDFFPFHDWKMSWPIYVYNICLSIVPAAYAWAFLDLATKKRNEIKTCAWLLVSRLPWFLLTCNITIFRVGFFGIGVIPIGYDALVFVLIGLVVLKATIYEQRL